MASAAAEKLDADLRAWTASVAGGTPSLEEIRAGAESLATFGAERTDVTVDEVDMGGRRALVHTPEEVRNGAILWLHGGGLTMGSPESHTRLAAHLAARSGLKVYNLDFRLAPENPFPAAADDTAAAVRWLIEQGVPSEQILLGGDSGGAAAALTTLIDQTQDGVRLAGGIFMSPWADFRLNAASYDANAATDVMCSHPMMVPLRENYVPTGEYEDPRVSPAFAGDLTGLPPLIIQASAAEVLVDDARLIARRAEEAGVDVTYTEFDVVPHVFQLFAGNLPEADEALQSVADWTARKVSAAA